MSASSAAYHLRVRDLVEALQREDQDAYVNVSMCRDKSNPTDPLFWDTEPVAGIEHRHGDRRYVELRGDY